MGNGYDLSVCRPHAYANNRVDHGNPLTLFVKNQVLCNHISIYETNDMWPNQWAPAWHVIMHSRQTEKEQALELRWWSVPPTSYSLIKHMTVPMTHTPTLLPISVKGSLHVGVQNHGNGDSLKFSALYPHPENAFSCWRKLLTQFQICLYNTICLFFLNPTVGIL